MGYQTFTPRGPLARFVETFWTYQADGSLLGRERTLPTGTMGVVISLRDEAIRVPNPDASDAYSTYRGGIVTGAASRYGIIERRAQADVVGVQFRPVGGFAFFGHPAGDFENRTVALEEVWGAFAHELRERLLVAPDAPAKARLLAEALVARAQPVERHPGVSHGVEELRRVPTRRSVLELTDEVGLRPKRFIELFREQVGLTPKLFARVQRFQSVVERVHCRDRVDWARVAAGAGYYDQAHFIHDFRGFTGLTPGRYLTARGDYMNHVPLEG